MFRIVEGIFVLIFFVELFLRIFVEGQLFVKDARLLSRASQDVVIEVANILDAVLVIGGLVDIIVSMQLDSFCHLSEPLRA